MNVCARLVIVFCFFAATAAGETRVFTARDIVTLDPKQANATAVAVRDGRISWVGSREDIASRFGEGVEIDRRFEKHVLTPGFVEPHLHPYIAGILLPMEFITPHDWTLPDRHFPGVRGREAYLARLSAYSDSLGEDDWAWTWGYHQLFHGKLSRADLDAVSRERPIIVWHRSFHEIYLNSAAIEAMGIDPSTRHPQVDMQAGHFYENGLVLLLPKLTPLLLEPTRYIGALSRAREVIHAGGITTVGDGAFGTLDLEQEWQSLLAAGWDSDDTPFRIQLLVDGKSLGMRQGHEQTADQIAGLPERNRHRLTIPGDQVKLFADGAAYSQLMQMSEPYTDGHHGEWLMTPEQLEQAARVYWQRGFQLHIHVNGDAGLDVILDILQALQKESPRRDHRTTIHHLAYARPDQAKQLAELGGMVQANPYYLWALSDTYAKHGLGPERAAGMVPLGSFAATGMPIALHSDFTMAPAQPLLLAWAAVNRESAAGRVMGAEEKITAETALRSITLDAAYQMGLENEIGSIEVGKKADFTVLADSPLSVSAGAIRDITVLGTVFEGRVYLRDPGENQAALLQSR